MNASLLFLFFIAIALGYALGRAEHKRRQRRQMSTLAGDYAKGINFLLNEQPDEAVEVLMDCLDVNDSTLETHLSLARVFRRRGEMDRATRIHETLLETDSLSVAGRDDVIYELAMDYLVGGVFDRAEQLFMEMVDQNSRHRYQAIRHLMQIFEQEKDWHSALAIGQKLLPHDDSTGLTLAHYCCELASGMIQNGSANAARRTIRRALQFDKSCARAWLLKGQLEASRGALRAALSTYRSLYELDSELFDEALPEVEQAYRQQKGEPAWLRFLADICIAQPSTPRVMRLAQGLEEHYGEEEAAHLIEEYMKENPSVQGVRRFVELKQDDADEPAREYLHLLRQLTHKLPDEDSHYQCRECGFNGREMHWQCPSCKSWGSVRPKRAPSVASL